MLVVFGHGWDTIAVVANPATLYMQLAHPSPSPPLVETHTHTHARIGNRITGFATMLSVRKHVSHHKCTNWQIYSPIRRMTNHNFRIRRNSTQLVELFEFLAHRFFASGPLRKYTTKCVNIWRVMFGWSTEKIIQVFVMDDCASIAKKLSMSNPMQ